MKNPIVFTWQLLTYFVVGIPLRCIFRITRKVNFLFRKGEVYIFAANHPSRFDPFFVCYALPFSLFLKIIPFRFITADEYLRIPLVGQLLLLYGCISTSGVNGKNVLDKSKDLMRRGETIFLFPNGKLEKKGVLKYSKVGFIYLERGVKNSCIVPIKISIDHRGSCPKVHVHFKEKIKHTSHPADLQPLADNVMKIIRK